MKGPESIGSALYEETDEEANALLFVLEEYLDPFYNRRLPYEKDIWKLLTEYSISDAAPELVSETKKLIEAYAIWPWCENNQ